ncbi:MAG TPA: PriCT-2 domain-containing protein [Nitrospiraceae bacterium]|nr:PriCT-2 domain-containing protein [Nitrospiraceae bacterium]
MDLDIKIGAVYNGVPAEDVRTSLMGRMSEITKCVNDAIVSECGPSVLRGPVFWMTKSGALGIHILFPESVISKQARKNVLRELTKYINPEILDLASSSVPCLLYGSKKTPASECYQISHVLVPPDYTPLSASDIIKNQYTAFDLRLVRTPPSSEDVDGAPNRDVAEISPRVADIVSQINNMYDIDIRVINNALNGETEDDDGGYLETPSPTLAEPEIERLLNRLPSDFYDDRDKWIKVVFCLANTNGGELKALAKRFSQKSTKYDETAFENLWNSALERARDDSSARRLTTRSLLKWVRDSYSVTGVKEYDDVLKDLIYQSRGSLPPGMVAILIRQKLNHLLMFGRTPATGEVWYSKVTDRDDPMFMKWELSTTVPREIYLEVVQDLPKCLLKAIPNSSEAVGKNLYNTLLRCYTPQFKQQITTEAGYLMYNKRAIAQLDANGDLLGVRNGIVLLGRTCRLVTSLDAELYVTRYADADYTESDHPGLTRWMEIVKKMYANVFIEPDALEFMQLMHAESLNGKSKYSPLLILLGSGSNGKSVSQNAMLTLLNIDGQSGYSVKPTMKLYTGNRTMEKSGDHNSELYSIKGRRFSYCEETERAEVMSSARLKELINVGGSITTRPPYGRAQETFKNICTFAVSSNYSLTVTTTEHGTWRRIAVYRAKTTFNDRPDPANPFEKLADPLYLTEYPNHPMFKAALLRTLLDKYEVLQDKYGGYVTRFSSPTIEHETREYRLTQDTLYLWITSTVVYSEELNCTLPLSEIAKQYKQDQCPKTATRAVEDMLKNSVLEKYICDQNTSPRPLVKNVKLVAFDYSLRDGERFVS